MTPPTSYRYAGGYNWCVGGVMTPPYRVRSTLIQLYEKLEFESVVDRIIHLFMGFVHSEKNGGLL